MVVALQAETPGWVPRMRAALGKEGEVAAVDRTPPPRGRGVQVRMDEGGDSWWFHPGALESIIPREARASAAGSPIVSHGGPASPASSPPRPSMQPPPPPPPPPRVAAASKGPPPPATLLANGLIELEPLGAERERPEGVFVYSKPSGGSVVGIVVPDGKTRVQVVDMR